MHGGIGPRHFRVRAGWAQALPDVSPLRALIVLLQNVAHLEYCSVTDEVCTLVNVTIVQLLEDGEAIG